MSTRCSGWRTFSFRTPPRLAGSPESTTSRRRRGRSPRTASIGRTDGGPIVAVKLGADGALACRADGAIVRVPAMPIEPTDTTGAGDSFNAGFLRAWLDGGDLRESLEFGVVCGALSTRRTGGVDGQATLREARDAIAAMAGR